MRQIQLSKTVYRDKVFACWLGKNIGGTLGAPYEDQKQVNDLTFYDPVPTLSTPNDDLDFQLVWLKMLEDKGVNPKLPDLAEYWVRYLSAYPWNEYGFCRRNLERGLRPPISGCFENYFVDEMGSPIRSEIWACIAPGEPQLAATLAWQDSALDHTGGEGTYGEMFWAATESAAFIIDDPKTLIQIGLQMIPLSCAISRVIREAVWCWTNGLRWAEARHRIVTVYGHHQSCNAIPNHGFTILGWLYGQDFGDRLCKAVNCGYDTDCTGATLGSVLGIIGGTDSIPEQWRQPIGETIVLHKFTGKFNAPKTITELTNRTVAIGEQFTAARSTTVELASRTSVPGDVLSLLLRNDQAQAILKQDIHTAVAVEDDLEITFHYGGEPVLYPGIKRTFGVSLRQGETSLKADIKIEAPAGWSVNGIIPGGITPRDRLSRQVSIPATKGHRYQFDILAQDVASRNTLTIIATLSERTYRTTFTILGPEEAKGFPSTANVTTCPQCGARQESCICK